MLKFGLIAGYTQKDKKSQVPHVRALGKLVATNGHYGHVGSGHYLFIYPPPPPPEKKINSEPEC